MIETKFYDLKCFHMRFGPTLRVGGFVAQVLQAAESTVKSLDAARRRALSPPVEPYPALEPFDESEGRDVNPKP